MSDMAIGGIGILILFVLVFLKVPLAVCMALVGVGGITVFTGWKAGFTALSMVPFSTISNYAIASLPLYVIMGAICFHGGVGQDLYYATNKLLGRFRGGLAVATIGACACFAAISASSLATTATLGKIALPEMKRYNYAPGLATGSIAAGGPLGILIPPSGILIIYGILVEESIGKLFIAGIVPGILEALLFMATILIVCRINPSMGPAGPQATIKEQITSLKSLWSVAILFGLVMGGIYFGLFSPTEGAGIGACGAVAVVLVKRRLTIVGIKSALIEAGSVTAMVMVVMIGANIMISFLAMSRLPAQLAAIISGLDMNPIVLMGFIILIYVVLGCVMDSIAMVLLTVPVLAPLASALGFDLIWFGIIIVVAVEMGGITPPIGVNVFIIKSIAMDVPLSTIFKGIVPFFFAILFLLILLLLIPDIVMFLPDMMKG
ncbi:MAG: TRAP transporter large permease [Dehalococcoidales bacterium]|nr:TRAP transporter large permease [Dehalococcoidales bacterium]